MYLWHSNASRVMCQGMDVPHGIFAAEGVWEGTALDGRMWFVQAVDRAGNVATNTNQGL